MMSGVTKREKQIIHDMVEHGDGDKMLPFPFMGWVECIAYTAYDWQFSGLLNNVFVEPDRDFSQCEQITHTGALLIGTYDNFTYGDPSGFLRIINDHIPTHDQNKLIFIEKTGHTYQMKHQEVADVILKLVQDWREEYSRDFIYFSAIIDPNFDAGSEAETINCGKLFLLLFVETTSRKVDEIEKAPQHLVITIACGAEMQNMRIAASYPITFDSRVNCTSFQKKLVQAHQFSHGHIFPSHVSGASLQTQVPLHRLKRFLTTRKPPIYGGFLRAALFSKVTS